MTDHGIKTLFLPGAGGCADFWRPVATILGGKNHLFAWPGLGDQPADPAVNNLDDLVRMVCDAMESPVDIVAQSMGGLIAIKAMLARPGIARRLVLTATSGGLPVAELGGADWRPDYYRTYPNAARWIGTAAEDLSAQIATIATPALLLWGDSDPISPVAVGETLLATLPHARLHVVPGGGHDLAQIHSVAVAQQIAAHRRDHPMPASRIG